MNIREYIESGILELYVMGSLTAEEQLEVKENITQYPELAEEVIEIEKSLMAFAESSAPVTLNEAIFKNAMSTIENQNVDKVIPITSAPKQIEKNVEFSGGNNKNRFLKFASIAASVAFLISVAGNIMFYNDLQNANQQLADLRNENSVFANEFEIQKAKYAVTENQLATVTNPDIVTIKMNGVEAQPDALATVFWNTKTNETYVNVNNLPTPPEGMQYQLWALYDGQPVDAGVFDLAQGIQPAKNIGNAQAFAVTLEEAGGKPTPNLEQLYVIGNV